MQWTFPRYQSTSVIPTSSSTWRMLRHSLVSPSRKEGPPIIWDTHGMSETFWKNNQRLPVASSTAPFTQELNPWISCVSEHTSPHAISESQTPVPKELWGRSTTTADFGFHFDKFPTPATFVRWKTRPKTEVCSCSQFPTEAMQWSRKWSWFIRWMKWDLRHLFEVFQCRILKYLIRGSLQHWTKSSVIPMSKEESVWRNKRPRSRTVSFVTDCLLDLRVLPGHWEPWFCRKLQPTCSLLFLEMTIFRNSIHSGTVFCPWRKSHLMISWNDCTNWEYESLMNSRPYWNCMTCRFIWRS